MIFNSITAFHFSQHTFCLNTCSLHLGTSEWTFLLCQKKNRVLMSNSSNFWLVNICSCCTPFLIVIPSQILVLIDPLCPIIIWKRFNRPTSCLNPCQCLIEALSQRVDLYPYIPAPHLDELTSHPKERFLSWK